MEPMNTDSVPFTYDNQANSASLSSNLFSPSFDPLYHDYTKSIPSFLFSLNQLAPLPPEVQNMPSISRFSIKNLMSDFTQTAMPITTLDSHFLELNAALEDQINKRRHLLLESINLPLLKKPSAPLSLSATTKPQPYMGSFTVKKGKAMKNRSKNIVIDEDSDVEEISCPKRTNFEPALRKRVKTLSSSSLDVLKSACIMVGEDVSNNDSDPSETETKVRISQNAALSSEDCYFDINDDDLSAEMSIDIEDIDISKPVEGLSLSREDENSISLASHNCNSGKHEPVAQHSSEGISTISNFINPFKPRLQLFDIKQYLQDKPSGDSKAGIATALIQPEPIHKTHDQASILQIIEIKDDEPCPDARTVAQRKTAISNKELLNAIRANQALGSKETKRVVSRPRLVQRARYRFESSLPKYNLKFYINPLRDLLL